jgi:hypothetical protein
LEAVVLPIFSMPVITHSRMSMSVGGMNLKELLWKPVICTGEDNDRLLTIVASHSSYSIRVDTADNRLTNNRMTAILILFSCANISD